MNNQEAKFVLGAYRPDGRDAGDPAFAEPLAQAERDPELRRWLERQQKFDAVISGKIRGIQPPAGLREAILAGGRASQPRRSWWSHPGWLAVAAAVAVLAAVAVKVKSGSAVPGAAELTSFAIHDLAESHSDHMGHPPSLAVEQAQLESAGLPLTANLKLDLADLQKKNCRSVRLGGRDVFEICFQRDGTWYHVYVGRRSDFAPGAIDPHALVTVRDAYAATTWVDANNVYTLVTRADADAIRRVI